MTQLTCFKMCVPVVIYTCIPRCLDVVKQSCVQTGCDDQMLPSHITSRSSMILWSRHPHRATFAASTRVCARLCVNLRIVRLAVFGQFCQWPIVCLSRTATCAIKSRRARVSARETRTPRAECRLFNCVFLLGSAEHSGRSHSPAAQQSSSSPIWPLLLPASRRCT